MVIEYPKGESMYVKLPIIGEEAVFDIATAERVEGGKFNFIEKSKQENEQGEIITVEKDLGYSYVYTMKDGKKLTISSWCPFFAFRDACVNDGMKIKVSHPEKGKWVVLPVDEGAPPLLDETGKALPF